MIISNSFSNYKIIPLNDMFLITDVLFVHRGRNIYFEWKYSGYELMNSIYFSLRRL